MFSHSFLNLYIMLKSIFFFLAFYCTRRKMYTPLFNKANQPRAFPYIIHYTLQSNCSKQYPFFYGFFFQIFNSLTNILDSLIYSFLHLLKQSQALDKTCYNQLHFHFLCHLVIFKKKYKAFWTKQSVRELWLFTLKAQKDIFLQK